MHLHSRAYQARHSPPVGGVVAMWHKRCNSANAHAPHAASSAFWRSAKLRTVRMRCAKHVLPRLHPVLVHAVAVTHQDACPVDEGCKSLFGTAWMDHGERHPL